MIDLSITFGAPETLTTWFIGRVLPPLITGVAVAVVASWMITRANERYKARRDYLLRDVDSLRAQLDTLIVASTKYWARANDDEARMLEPQIEYLLADIDSLVRACAPDLWADSRSAGPDLVAKLIAESATDRFGSSRLAADDLRARRVAGFAAELAELATEQRRRYLTTAFRWPWQSAAPRYGS